MQHIHVSDMRTFKSCRIKWDFQSPLRKGLQPRSTPKALWKGTLIHKTLEMWYESQKGTPLMECWGRTWENELLRQAVLGVSEASDLDDKAFRSILKTYERWAKTNDHGFTTIGVEQDFVVPLSQGLSLAGRFDQVIQMPDGGIWVHDFKVMQGDFSGFVNFLMGQDDQARAYSWAGRQLFGSAFRGIMYTLIRSKAPTVPHILKPAKGETRGKVSANKALDSTVEVFLEALAANGQTLTAEYDDVMEALISRSAAQPWVLRASLAFSDSAMETFEEQLANVAEDMLNAPYLAPAASYLTCRGCAYSSPCAAYLKFGMAEAENILDRFYVTSDYTRQAIDLMDSDE